ncbi:gamma-glutamyl-gamma-aminobutyrate hydrolase family protein [Limnochorda pilosa]|uniref:Peptidase C26 n=1 Tax=Limnochorda pilosa TaxID=1555112 RepID=A0A0K2SJK6_LIMPI|nr:gamma-glutamyl-gamma-aminobutyrate hydrolase family protein [Limnochorda pilosa]BAS27275.1 peptidase C26 [Limnochorda pilosa]
MPDERPLIGITVAFDDGTDLESLRPHVELFFSDAPYARAIERAGGLPVLVPLVGEQALPGFIRQMDGLLFSGGGGYLRARHRRQQQLPDLEALAPRRFRFESALLRAALAADTPVLGVCRGHQMIVRLLGGRIRASLPPGAHAHYREEVPIGRRPVHGIRIEPDSLLAAILGRTEIGVNSLHRQAARWVAPPLRVSARAEDGVIEAVESRAHSFVLGVQFHPELLLAEQPRWLRLFDSLVRAAGRHRLVREGHPPAGGALTGTDRASTGTDGAAVGDGATAPAAGVAVGHAASSSAARLE